MMNPKSNFKDYIHPIVTTLELGYLATHNSIIKFTIVMNYHNKIRRKRYRELTLKTHKRHSPVVPVKN